MENIEQLKSKLQFLLDEQRKLLRGFGQRYARRFKISPYDRSIHGKRDEYDNNIKVRMSRTKTSIGRAKGRLLQIGEEIADIKNKIKELDLENTKSSPVFNKAISNVLEQF